MFENANEREEGEESGKEFVQSRLVLMERTVEEDEKEEIDAEMRSRETEIRRVALIKGIFKFGKPRRNK